MAAFKYGDFEIEAQLSEQPFGQFDVRYTVRAPNGDMTFRHREILPRARLGETEDERQGAVVAMAKHAADVVRRAKLQATPIDSGSREGFERAIREAGQDPDGFRIQHVVDDIPLGDGRYTPRRFIFVTCGVNRTSRAYISAGDDSWVDEFAEDLAGGLFR